MNRWNIKQGSSSCTVTAPDYQAARDRAAQIGFSDPESVVLATENGEPMSQFWPLVRAGSRYLIAGDGSLCGGRIVRELGAA